MDLKLIVLLTILCLGMPFHRKCCFAVSGKCSGDLQNIKYITQSIKNSLLNMGMPKRKMTYGFICERCVEEAGIINDSKTNGNILVDVGVQTDNEYQVSIETQQDRIKALDKILSIEKKSTMDFLYNRSTTPIADHVETYDPSKSFKNTNPVIEKLLNIGNDFKRPESKFFTIKKTLIVDLLVSMVYSRFVSPLCFAINLLNYSVTGCKQSTEILSHLLPCGSYTFLTNWLSNLSIREIAKPVKGVLTYVLDNNQRLQRVWISRNNNKQNLEAMTNVLRVELSQGNEQFQDSLDPVNWRNFTNIDESFTLSIPNENVHCLSDTFDKLSQNVNDSDQIGNKLKLKKQKENQILCKNCNIFWNKSKIKCNNCKKNIRLQLNDSVVKSTKQIPHPRRNDSWKFHTYVPGKDSCNLKRKSLEYSNSESKKTKLSVVNTPKMTLIDPVFVNPSSYEAVKTVLDEIGKDAGIKQYGSGDRNWVFVVCDGSPMSLIWKLLFSDPLKYSWVVPITGLGHEEMNMVKAFIELYYDVILKDFFKSQGYLSIKSLAFAKGAFDHHIAFDNLMKFREAIWLELIFSFKNSMDCEVYSFETFLQWVSNTNDDTLKHIVFTMLPFLESIFVFREGVRNNVSSKILFAREIFRPIWYGRLHPKYLMIDFFDQCSRNLMPPEILNTVTNHESITASGRNDAHQGLDFILEEFNKNVKKHICGVANSNKWTTVIRNLDRLNILRKNMCDFLSLNLDEKYPRQMVNYEWERDNFRTVLRERSYLDPKQGRTLESLDDQVKIAPSFANFKENSAKAVSIFMSNFKKTFQFPSKIFLKKIPITVLEEEETKKDESRTNLELLAMIEENISKLNLELKQEYVAKMKTMKIKTSKKSVMIEFLREIRKEVDHVFSEEL